YVWRRKSEKRSRSASASSDHSTFIAHAVLTGFPLVPKIRLLSPNTTPASMHFHALHFPVPGFRSHPCPAPQQPTVFETWLPNAGSRHRRDIIRPRVCRAVRERGDAALRLSYRSHPVEAVVEG